MDSLVKVVGIIQARITSNRLPAKVMLNLAGKTILERVVDRVKLSDVINDIWIATSNLPQDNLIENLSHKIGIKSFRGNLNNVLDRFYETMKISKADVIVRITADNPLTEPRLINEAVRYLINNKVDYVRFENIPIGSGVEVFTHQSFIKVAEAGDLTPHNIEHVTSYYYQHPELFSIALLQDNQFTKEQIAKRVTVDTIEDYIKLGSLYQIFEEEDVNPIGYLEKALTISLD